MLLYIYTIKIMHNNIYSIPENTESIRVTPPNGNGSYFKQDRINILDNEISKEFNTYRNWNHFELLMEKGKMTHRPLGVKSLFNNVNAIYGNIALRDEMNIPLLDSPESRKRIREQTDCSIKSLVKASEDGSMGRAIYNYSDFMFCKHLGKMRNNQLITLRRFAYPCGDHINISSAQERLAKTQQHQPDIGRLITWMGTPDNDMSSILHYDMKMSWKSISAPNGDAEQANASDSSIGPLGKMMNVFNSSYAKSVQAGVNDTNLPEQLTLPGKKGINIPLGTSSAPFSNAAWLRNFDNNKTYGPIDMITKTNIRSDEGLDFNQNINLTFDYELRSYDGVNGRAAMLDLIGNILAVGYTSGKFWPGVHRFYGAHQSNLFANLPIYKADLSSPSSVAKGVWDSFSSVGSSLFGGEGGLMGGLKALGKNLFGGLMGGMLNKLGRPQKYALQSLLSPAPTGPWHLTVGNPRNPIMSMGNMKVDSCDIEQYGPLGIDDFPTGLKVKISLSHCKPRDASQIEMMYLGGDWRIYTPMSGQLMTMYDAAIDLNQSKSNTLITTNSGDGVSLLPSNNVSIQSISTTSSNNSLSKKKKMKYFGTDDEQAIVQISKESFQGATPSKGEGAPSNK